MMGFPVHEPDERLLNRNSAFEHGFHGGVVTAKLHFAYIENFVTLRNKRVCVYGLNDGLGKTEKYYLFSNN